MINPFTLNRPRQKILMGLGILGLVPWLGWSEEPVGIQSGSGVVEGWTFTLREQGALKARFSGALARPVRSSEFDVEQLYVETFRADGELDVVARAPQCRVIFTNDSFVVRSPGPLHLVQVDGRFEVDGRGFVWDHAAQNLVVTNRGQTRLRVDLPRPGDWE